MNTAAATAESLGARIGRLARVSNSERPTKQIKPPISQGALERQRNCARDESLAHAPIGPQEMESFRTMLRLRIYMLPTKPNPA